MTRPNKPIVAVNIMGGLGNQLFQIASAYAYARKENGQLQIIRKTDNGNRPVYWDSFLKSVEPYLVRELPPNLEQWSEEVSTKYKSIGPLKPRGKYLNGYLLSSKYFYTDDIKQEIKDLFKQDINITNKYKYLCENKSRIVVMHCRRTDYLKAADFHAPLNGAYYTQAVREMLQKVENPIFLLCGDDVNYWSEISDNISEIYKYEWQILQNESDINTINLLSQMENFIMSNSTFIWWAVWLSVGKNVIVPKKWFGPIGPQEWEDIYEESWIRL